jgi:poly(A) polymerase
MLVGLELSRTILPEIDALQDVLQSDFHHLDVYEHTLAVLAQVIALDADPGQSLGSEHAEAIRALLDEPLGDEVSRRVGLRFAALLHDVAKPATRSELANGRIGFPAHDELGARSAREILRRLRASERMRAHVAALVGHHLRLGFLVGRAPISRDELYSYLSAAGPVAADVTLLSVADRLATRGARSAEMIDAHLELAREVIGEALRWHRDGAPRALLRGDELAAALGIAQGPLVGRLLTALARASFNGEIHTREQAIDYARNQL